MKDVGGIPKEGHDAVLVADVNHRLHFRIFDGEGKIVVDVDEKKLNDQAPRIGVLKKQLEPLWPRRELNRSQKAPVLAAVTSISVMPPGGIGRC